ncbi:MAG: small multi-drug export protein [Patescibacteria group bacterium]|nr:small multi-drug export protein [Patescibacteria group bacterium]MDD5490692.1 small multi-drug export protein [Patescibacteria group bacterium]
MTETLINAVKNLPPELAVLILAMFPLTELRASIPLGLTIFHLNVFSTFIFSVIGDIIPMLVIIYLLEPASLWLSKKWRLAEKFFNWLFARTRRKFTGNYQKYGEIGLMIFVAIPLPLTGSWTGAVAAFLFGIPKKRAIIFISAGVVLAGIAVTILSLSGITLFNNF